MWARKPPQLAPIHIRPVAHYQPAPVCSKDLVSLGALSIVRAQKTVVGRGSWPEATGLRGGLLVSLCVSPLTLWPARLCPLSVP